MKKVLLSILMCLSSVAMLCASEPWDGVTVATSFSGGDGTRSNPYLISTPAELAFLGKQVNEDSIDFKGKYLKLIADIDLNGKDWTPIGAHEIAKTPENDANFNGNLDGDGHLILNLFINLPEKSEVGLFGFIEGDTIQNLGIAGNSKIVGLGSVGALTGKMYSSLGKPATAILNCFSVAEVVGSGDNVGGLIGQIYVNNGSESGSVYVQSCYTKGSVNGGNYVGGITGGTGSKNRTYLYNSYSAATVSAINGTAYGISFKGTGKMEIRDCYFLHGEATQASTGVSVQKTAEEMKSEDFVTELNGVPTVDAWKADYTDNINEGYPILFWQEPSGGTSGLAAVQTESIQLSTSGKNILVSSLSDANISVSVYNQAGVCVGQGGSNGQQVSISVTNTGLYLVKVLTEGSRTVKKVLVY